LFTVNYLTRNIPVKIWKVLSPTVGKIGAGCFNGLVKENLKEKTDTQKEARQINKK
jgi:hypothetical protein